MPEKIVKLTQEQLEYVQDTISAAQQDADDAGKARLSVAIGVILDRLDNAEDAK